MTHAEAKRLVRRRNLLAKWIDTMSEWMPEYPNDEAIQISKCRQDMKKYQEYLANRII